MTGYASVDTAVEAIKLGAMDYLSKPLDFARLEQLLTAVREEIERRRSLLSMESDLAQRLEFCGMIGRGPLMQELFGMIRRLAPHVRTALDHRRDRHRQGAGGARAAPAPVRAAIAGSSPSTARRSSRRCSRASCSATCAAPSPARPSTSRGCSKPADGGTLFLDEIGELPLTVQAKLLRVLEIGEVQRVGSLEPRRVNVHVIAATNRDLRAEVAGGRFRSDLYYRLNIVEVKLPPLRDRREDIPYLTAAFVRERRSGCRSRSPD